jgi:taurine dioxygenase
MSYCPLPEIANSLLAIDVSEGETSTRFANGVRALSMLSASTMARIEGLEAEHRYATDLEVQGRKFGTPREPPVANQPIGTHPVVFPSPYSGEPVLYVMQQSTHYILNIPVEESDALLEELWKTLYARTNVYEHWWHNGDLVIWDNVAVQHSRQDQSKVARRTLQRIMITEKTLQQQFPNSRRTWVPFQGRAVLQADT